MYYYNVYEQIQIIAFILLKGKEPGKMNRTNEWMIVNQREVDL